METLKNKIIIRNYTDHSDLHVLELVKSIVAQGRMSETSKGSQYCFHTTFLDGTNISIIKSGKDTETFYVYMEGDLRHGE